jgi:hypothetical protein
MLIFCKRKIGNFESLMLEKSDKSNTNRPSVRIGLFLKNASTVLLTAMLKSDAGGRYPGN